MQDSLVRRKLSVCLSNMWIVTKQKKDLSRFLYHTKDHLACFLRKGIVRGGNPFYLKFLVNQAPIGVKSSLLNQYSLIETKP